MQLLLILFSVIHPEILIFTFWSTKNTFSNKSIVNFREVSIGDARKVSNRKWKYMTRVKIAATIC